VFTKDVDILMLSTTLLGTINQAISTQVFYRRIHQLEDLPQEEFDDHLKQKLSIHLKKIFKAILDKELNEAIAS